MKKSILFSFFLIATASMNAQIDFKQFVPPNPDVGAIMKPILTPVTEYAGIPNIGIPIYTIQLNDFSLPLSLNYHAGGIRVGEEASNVGLGWSLSAGGVITRTINGFDDFRADNSGYLNHNESLPNVPVLGGDFKPDINRFIQSLGSCEFFVNGEVTQLSPVEVNYPLQIDHMPDEFTYSINGLSGSFYFNRDGSIFKTEKDGTIIVPEFIATQLTYENQSRYDSTWYVSKITTKNNREIIFNYEKWGKFHPLKTFIQDFYDAEIGPDDPCLILPQVQCNGNNYRNYSGPQSEIDGIYLTNISFANGNVNFVYSNEGEREDIHTGYFVDKIEIENESRQISKFDFNYSYFTGSLTKRLRLDNIVQDDEREHSFEYHSYFNKFPSKTSMGQDYWGFYNGARNGNYFIPKTAQLPQIQTANSADRLPYETAAKTFSLKRITYPTQGLTEFDYELNTFNAEALTNQPVPATVAKEAKARAYNGVPTDITLPFDPNPIGSMKMDFQFAIYGSTLDRNETTGQYQPGPFNYQQDAYAQLLNADTGEVIWTEPLTSEATSLQFLQTGMAFYSISRETSRHQNVDNYQLKVHFNDHNETYFGQAQIILKWLEESVTGTAANPKQYSIGGGLRVKSITDYSEPGKIAQKRNYNYHYKEIIDGIEIEKSYGKIKTLPNYNINKSPLYVYVDLFELSDSDVWFPEKQSQIQATATTTNSFAKDQGSYVGYDQVELTYEDVSGLDNGKTVYKFHNSQDLYDDARVELYWGGALKSDDYHEFPAIRLPNNGLLKETEEYKKDNAGQYHLVQKLINDYEVNGIPALDFNFESLYFNSDFLISAKKEIDATRYYLEDNAGASVITCDWLQYYPHYSNRVELKSTTNILFDENGLNPVTVTQNTFYDNDLHYLPTRTEMTDSKGNTLSTQTWYPDDIDTTINNIEGGAFDTPSLTAINDLKGSISTNTNKRMGQPVQTVSINNGKKLIQRTNLENFDNGIILPKTQVSLKGEVSTSNPLQERSTIHSYDNFGNPLEVSIDQGPITSFIWGHNNTYLIAKIENASYADIANALSIPEENIKLFSEINMGTIDGLRSNPSLSKSLVTTFVYDPLVGITSVTDPRNYKMNYFYDPQRRLIAVKDENDHLVTDYEYHYKDQSN